MGLRVLISQKVDSFAKRDERCDMLDQNWLPTLIELLDESISLVPVPNSDAKMFLPLLNKLEPNLIVLSGGNDIGSIPERDEMETALLEFSRREHIPVLGVCRGMQMIQHFLGGALIQTSGHAGTSHNVLASDASVAPKRMEVNSFHKLGVARKDMAEDLVPLYLHESNVEALEHRKLPWLGIMWHPERKSNSREADIWLSKRLVTLL